VSDLSTEISRKLQLWLRNHTRAAICSNTFIQGNPWECDVLAVMPSLLYYEYEIKVSDSDYRRDFTKKVSRYYRDEAKQWQGVKVTKHEWLNAQDNILNRGVKPSKFYFVMPAELIREVPEYCGLIAYGSDFGYYGFKIMKQAGRLRGAEKLSNTQLFNLLYKAGYKS